MTGRVLGASTALACSKFVSVQYDANTVTQKVFVAPFPLLLTAIQGVTRVAGSGGACTFTFFKTASAVASASGTSLSSGSFNVVGTADTNQSLTLSSDINAVTFAAGDAIGMVLTGTPTSAVGNVTFTFEPVA